jgi:hypothetical protein
MRLISWPEEEEEEEEKDCKDLIEIFRHLKKHSNAYILLLNEHK